MTRRYRFYINGGLGERMLSLLRNDLPNVLFDSEESSHPFAGTVGGVFPFGVFAGGAADPSIYEIDKIAEEITTFNLVLDDEAYLDIVFVDRPEEAIELDDTTWFDTLIETTKQIIVFYSIIVEQLDTEEEE